jgi:hypothetical protein
MDHGVDDAELERGGCGRIAEAFPSAEVSAEMELEWLRHFVHVHGQNGGREQQSDKAGSNVHAVSPSEAMIFPISCVPDRAKNRSCGESRLRRPPALAPSAGGVY